MFTVNKNGDIVLTIKNTMDMAKDKQDRAIEQYNYRTEKNNGVISHIFTLDKKKQNEIDNPFSSPDNKPVTTNSLAVKIIERVSSYFYNKSNWVARQETSVAAHNNKSHVGTSSSFAGQLLGFHPHDTTDFKSIIKLKTIAPDEPIYLGINYGEKDKYQTFHPRHALKVKEIRNDQCVLVNPWNNRKTETYTLADIKTKEPRFCVFYATQKKKDLSWLILQLDEALGKYVFANKQLNNFLLYSIKGSLEVDENFIKNAISLHKKVTKVRGDEAFLPQIVAHGRIDVFNCLISQNFEADFQTLVSRKSIVQHYPKQAPQQPDPNPAPIRQQKSKQSVIPSRPIQTDVAKATRIIRDKVKIVDDIVVSFAGCQSMADIQNRKAQLSRRVESYKTPGYNWAIDILGYTPSEISKASAYKMQEIEDAANHEIINLCLADIESYEASFDPNREISQQVKPHINNLYAISEQQHQGLKNALIALQLTDPSKNPVRAAIHKKKGEINELAKKEVNRIANVNTILKDIKFEKHLLKIKSKRDSFAGKTDSNFKLAHALATTLYDNLDKARNQLKSGTITVDVFKNICTQALDNAKKSKLKDHRGWGEVLTNFASILLSISTVGLMNIAFKRWILFAPPTTQSVKKIVEMEKSFENIKSPKN